MRVFIFIFKEYNINMQKIIFFIIGLSILLFIGYKYFHLDQNVSFQKSLKDKDLDSAEIIARDVVKDKLQTQVRKFFYDHNSYFVSQSNNICTSMQSNFDALRKIIDNPVECFANVHTFTARIKTPTNKYYCADASGFYTTTIDEIGYKSGVSCK